MTVIAGYQPMGASPYATYAAAPAAAHKPGFVERMRDTFSSIGLALGFGDTSKEIKQAFRSLDQHKSNSLDLEEFGAVGNAFGEGLNGHAAADANHNQRVSYGEFKDWVRGHTRQEFERFDVNHDRYLDQNELGAVQAQAGFGAAVSGIDANQDQFVSFREFLRFRVSQLTGMAMMAPALNQGGGLRIPEAIFYR